MACKNICKLCDKLVLSIGVDYVDGTGLLITLPEGSYLNGEKYCIVIAQAIPAATVINAPVVIRLGVTGANLYELRNCDCSQVTACGIKTRTKYSTRVITDSTTGVFKLLSKVNCYENNIPALT